MSGDKAVRWTAVAAVLSVAGVAAWVSYWHAVAVVSGHGEPGLTGHLYPVVIDGLIIAASMVLLDSARYPGDTPVLAWWMLGAGIGATLAMNVLAGLPYGWLASVVATWPALAFVGCYELLMMLVRAAARRAPAARQEPGTVPQAAAVPAGTEVAATVQDAARAAYAASVENGSPISERGLARQFGLPRSQVRKLRTDVVRAPAETAA